MTARQTLAIAVCILIVASTNGPMIRLWRAEIRWLWRRLLWILALVEVAFWGVVVRILERRTR